MNNIIMKIIRNLRAKYKNMEPNKCIACKSTLRVHLTCDSLELNDFAISLKSLDDEFKSFAKENASSDEQVDSKLYVSKIEKGSIIVDLVEYASVTFLPLMIENPDMIFSFAKYMRLIYDFFIKGKGEKPELTKKSLDNYAKIVLPVVRDNNGNLNITAINNITENVYSNCNFSFDNNKANAFQNKLCVEAKKLEEITSKENVFNKVLMELRQIRKNDKKHKGNKAIISSITNNPLNLICDTDEIEYDILKSEKNPLETAFLVDVIVMDLRGNPFAYKVTHIYNSFPITENKI